MPSGWFEETRVNRTHTSEREAHTGCYGWAHLMPGQYPNEQRYRRVRSPEGNEDVSWPSLPSGRAGAQVGARSSPRHEPPCPARTYVPTSADRASANRAGRGSTHERRGPEITIRPRPAGTSLATAACRPHAANDPTTEYAAANPPGGPHWTIQQNARGGDTSAV
jgi:hypothetical protein